MIGALPALSERLQGAVVAVSFHDEIGRTAAALLQRCGARVIADAEPPTSDGDDYWHKIAGKYGRLDAVLFNPPLLHERPMLVRFLQMCAAVPDLMKGAPAPHIVVIAPPVTGLPDYASAAAAGSAFALSAAAYAACGTLYRRGIALNGVWPRGVVDTASVRRAFPHLQGCFRSPELTALAAISPFTKPALACAGNFMLDDLAVEAEGVSILPYCPASPGRLMPFIPSDAEKAPEGVVLIAP